jgi:hypothetical protein
VDIVPSTVSGSQTTSWQFFTGIWLVMTMLRSSPPPTASRLPKDQEFLSRHSLEGRKVGAYIGTVGTTHGLEIMLKAAEARRYLPWA